MALRATPMIHVPDVRATTEWYELVGFKVEDTNECDGVIDWALLSFGARVHRPRSERVLGDVQPAVGDSIIALSGERAPNRPLLTDAGAVAERQYR